MSHRKGWRDEVVPAYEEGGRAIGRAIMYDPAAEDQIWGFIVGTSIWPKWYLKCFATLYREENVKEYGAMRKRKAYARDRMKRQREAAKRPCPPQTQDPPRDK